MVLLDGLPLHPLLVHAPVVLVPLVAVGWLIWLLLPGTRRVLGPVLAVVALVAAATAVGAVWSGAQLEEALGRGDELERHADLGRLTRWYAIVVAVGAVVTVVLDRSSSSRRRLVFPAAIVTAGVAMAASVMVALTGHAGATLAWEGRVPDAGAAESEASGTTSASRDPLAGDVSDTGPGPGSGEAADPLPGAGQPGVDLVLGEWTIVTAVDQAVPGPVTFRFRNMGTMAHAVRIRSTGSGGDRLEWRSERVQPGEVGLLVADLPVGTYEIDCPIEDAAGEHDQLGMEISFEVHDAAPPLLALPDGTAIAPDPGDAEPRQDDATAVGTVTVGIRAFAYLPDPIQVPAGTEVVWVNHDAARHTATGDAFDTGALARGEQASFVTSTPGSYAYHCTIHPAMRGTVIVEP